DPGHGGEDAGVRAASGATEKDLALSIAKRVQSRLEGETRVLLTRPGDTRMPPDERAAFANQSRASLFVSIHAASSPSPAARGLAVFYHDASGVAAAPTQGR